MIHSDIQERYVVVIDGLDELEETELEDLLKQLEWLCLEPGKHRSSAGSTIANLPLTILALGRPSLDDYVGSHAGNLKLDKNLALHRIAKICLRLLTDSTVFSEFGLDHSLTQHAALNFSRNLDQIHRSELPLDLQRGIAQASSRLFRERLLTRRWISILAALPAQTKLDNMLKDKSLNEKSLTICCSWLDFRRRSMWPGSKELGPPTTNTIILPSFSSLRPASSLGSTTCSQDWVGTRPGILMIKIRQEPWS